MKRFFFSVIALAAVATGCTKSEMVETPDFGGQEITFETYLGKVPTTKAESVDLAYLQGANRGFHVTAFLHDKDTQPSAASIADPYMDKDVSWASSDDTNIPDETATTKVIFTTQDGDTAPAKPTVDASATYEDFKCPEGWTDFPTSESTHYVVCTFTAPAESVNIGSWEVGTVTKIETFSNNKGNWTYDGVTYWPDANSKKYLAFVAYGVNTATTTDGVKTWANSNITAGSDKTSISFTVEDEVASQTDLIVAPYQNNKILNANSSNTTVPLNFKHVLSRVGFKLVANQDNNVEIIVKSVELKGSFAKTGTVDLTNADPAITADAVTTGLTYSLFPSSGSNCFVHNASTTPASIFVNATYAVSTDVNKPSEDYVTATKISTETTLTANEASRYMMLMPTATAGTYEILVEYQLNDAAPETAKVELTNWSFAKGKAYEFVLKVSTSAVGFYVEVADWEKGTVDASYTLTPSTNN